MERKSQYLAKSANFGAKNPNVFGNESFVTYITEHLLGTLIALFFSREWDQMDQKCRYLARNVNFGQYPFFGGEGVKLLIPTY